jgi:hypothetical protein
LFRLTRKLYLHHVQSTSAERLTGGVQTLGLIQSLRKLGVSDEEMGLTALAEVAERHLGDGEVPLYVSYVVHLGVTPESG